MTQPITDGIDADGYRVTPLPNAKTATCANSGGTITYCVETSAPFTVTAWNSATPHPDNLPFWHQPFDPSTGLPFPDQATAQSFADAWIQDNFVSPPAPAAAPTAPAAAATPTPAS
jgi:hypothetical protein